MSIWVATKIFRIGKWHELIWKGLFLKSRRHFHIHCSLDLMAKISILSFSGLLRQKKKESSTIWDDEDGDDDNNVDNDAIKTLSLSQFLFFSSLYCLTHSLTCWFFLWKVLFIHHTTSSTSRQPLKAQYDWQKFNLSIAEINRFTSLRKRQCWISRWLVSSTFFSVFLAWIEEMRGRRRLKIELLLLLLFFSSFVMLLCFSAARSFVDETRFVVYVTKVTIICRLFATLMFEGLREGGEVEGGRSDNGVE